VGLGEVRPGAPHLCILKGTVEGTRFTITPEPATLAPVGIGLAVMGLRRRT